MKEFLEKSLFVILSRRIDCKGTDFNLMNGPCSTIDIYDAIRSCTYDHTTMIDRQMILLGVRLLHDCILARLIYAKCCWTKP